MRFYFLSILSALFLFTSCGDSPFLNDEAPPSESIGKTRALDSALLFPISRFSVKTFWRQGPSISTESKLLILISNVDGIPSSLKESLIIKLWMPTMGHGSFPVKVTRIGEGVYELSEIYFTMNGIWDIHFQRSNDEEILEEIKWQLKL